MNFELGQREALHEVAPEDWNENGVEYGAFCKCCKCGRVAPSTFMFDFYAKEPGHFLECELCARERWINEAS